MSNLWVAEQGEWYRVVRKMRYSIEAGEWLDQRHRAAAIERAWKQGIAGLEKHGYRIVGPAAWNHPALGPVSGMTPEGPLPHLDFAENVGPDQDFKGAEDAPQPGKMEGQHHLVDFVLRVRCYVRDHDRIRSLQSGSQRLILPHVNH